MKSVDVWGHDELSSTISTFKILLTGASTAIFQDVFRVTLRTLHKLKFKAGYKE